MTHAWLITGPPGSGRSVAARVLCCGAAVHLRRRAGLRALQGVRDDDGGHARRRAPDHPGGALDRRRRDARRSCRSRRGGPSTGRWQVVVIEDADRLTEGAANALLKVVEEPPPSTVFLLCAPSVDPEDIAITLRSRCRHVALVTPTVDAIAQVLVDTDGLSAEDAQWAASVSGGHVGRARRLATDPAARERRERALGLARDAATPSRAYAAAEELVATAETEARALTAGPGRDRDRGAATALGAGGTGQGHRGDDARRDGRDQRP